MASITLTDKNLNITSDRSAKPITYPVSSNIIVSYSGTTWANGTVKMTIGDRPFVFAGSWDRSLLGPLNLVGATDTSALTPAQTAAALSTLIKDI